MEDFWGLRNFQKKTIKYLKKRLVNKILKNNKKIDFTNFLMELIKNNLESKCYF